MHSFKSTPKALVFSNEYYSRYVVCAWMKPTIPDTLCLVSKTYTYEFIRQNEQSS